MTLPWTSLSSEKSESYLLPLFLTSHIKSNRKSCWFNHQVVGETLHSSPRLLHSAAASLLVPSLSFPSASYSPFSMHFEVRMTLELQLFHLILPFQWLRFSHRIPSKLSILPLTLPRFSSGTVLPACSQPISYPALLPISLACPPQGVCICCSFWLLHSPSFNCFHDHCLFILLSYPLSRPQQAFSWMVTLP